MHKIIFIPLFLRKIVSQFIYMVEHPRKFYRYVLLKKVVFKLSCIFPDKIYIELMFPLCTGYKLNLENPQTFNEKLQWLKLNYRKPEFSIMVDKIEAKNYVAGIIGEDHIIPTLAIYKNTKEINFDTLPDQFVLKCTHDSGNIIICKDKSSTNRSQILRKLEKGLKYNYFNFGREWVYKDVEPRIIAEKYMTDGGEELKDYKIFCFGGEPKMVEVDYNRFIDHKRQLFTIDWEKIDATCMYPSDSTVIEKPVLLSQMLDYARKLSKGHPFLRTDFYIINNKIYFGELTFYHQCGFGPIEPVEFDLEMGSWIQLPQPTI